MDSGEVTVRTVYILVLSFENSRSLHCVSEFARSNVLCTYTYTMYRYIGIIHVQHVYVHVHV